MTDINQLPTEGRVKKGPIKPIMYKKSWYLGWKELYEELINEGYPLSKGLVKDMTNPKRGLSHIKKKLYPELEPVFLDDDDINSDKFQEAYKQNRLIVITRRGGYRPANGRGNI